MLGGLYRVNRLCEVYRQALELTIGSQRTLSKDASRRGRRDAMVANAFLGEIEEGNARATGFLGGGDGEEECSEGMLLLLLLLRCVSGAGK